MLNCFIYETISVCNWNTADRHLMFKARSQPLEWEKVIANEATDKGLISKMQHQLMELSIRKTKNQSNKQTTTTTTTKKRAEDLKSNLSKEGIQMANRHRKRCLLSFIIKEMLIATTLRCHRRLVRVTILKKSTSDKCWQGCGEKAALLHC